MAILQSDKIAEDHFANRIKWMFENCEGIAPLVASDRFAIRRNEARFTDGLPFYVTGPGINNLQTRGIRYMSLDEPWLYKAGTVAEAEGRLGDFRKMRTSKALLVSQGGVPDDDMDQRWKVGSQKAWLVRCQSCHEAFDPVWNGKRSDGTRYGMMWDQHRDERNQWLVAKCLESMRYECPLCGHPHLDHPRTRSEWNRTGDYAAGNVNAARASDSFRWNAVIDTQWSDLVANYLEAVNARHLGIYEPLIKFNQKQLALPMDESSMMDASFEIVRVKYDIESPDGEIMRLITADRQEEDVFWVLVCSWSKDECRKLWYGRCFSFIEIVQVQKNWKCENVWIDSGYKPKGDSGVYAACVQNGWVACKGMDQDIFWHEKKGGRARQRVMRSYSERKWGDPESGLRGQGKRLSPLVMFSSNSMADRLNGMVQHGVFVDPIVDVETPMDLEFRRQMSAEHKRPKLDKNTGRTKLVWVQKRRDNHAWDCGKMQVLVATIKGMLPDDPANAENLEKN